MKDMKTDYRTESFKAKFENAGKHLGVASDQVISLKLRDRVSSYSEYHDMLRFLEHEAGIQSSPIKNDLQGKGHLVGQGDQKIIIVEHETGLEILYIAGSIASLIGLIPLVLQSWGAIRGYLSRRHASHIQSVEIRKIDNAGKLLEDHIHDFPTSLAFPHSMLNSALLSAAHVLETDLQSLKHEVQSQSERLAAMEKGLKAPMKRMAAKRRIDKGSPKKILKRKTAKSRRAL